MNEGINEITETVKADRFNPFANADEYTHFTEDYRAIVPQISMDNCIIPDEPDAREKRNIKSCFNKVGFMLIMEFIAINIFVIICSVIGTLTGAIDWVNGDISDSSFNIGITGIGYMVMNILVFFIGCKITNIDRSSLFKTKNLDGTDMAIYIAAGLFLQAFSVLFATLVVPVFDVIFGTDTYGKLADLDSLKSITQIIATCLYTCIIAPVTEELVLRGFVLKNLSRTNQLFGIIATSFLFGLIHDNVPQFILAFTVGILLGYITIKHNSILPAIAVHIVINTSSTIISLISEISVSAGNVISVIWEFGVLIFGLAVVVFAFAKGKFKFPKPVKAQKKRGFSLFFTTPCIVILVLIHICMSIWVMVA